MAFNQLTDAEAELLATLAEEAAEVIQCITKILRHGLWSYNPGDAEATPNKRDLEKEIADFTAVLILCQLEGFISTEDITGQVPTAVKSKLIWMHHQDKEGKEQ